MGLWDTISNIATAPLGVVKPITNVITGGDGGIAGDVAEQVFNPFGALGTAAGLVKPPKGSALDYIANPISNIASTGPVKDILTIPKKAVRDLPPGLAPIAEATGVAPESLPGAPDPSTTSVSTEVGAPSRPAYTETPYHLAPESNLQEFVQANPLEFKTVMPGLEDKLSGINLNQQGLEAYRKRALSTGPSAWANLAMKQQGLEERQLKDQLGEEQAGSVAQAMGQLARQGGLSSGARERIAESAAKGRIMAGQNLASSGAQARLGILGQDESQRMQALGNLPGMEVQALSPALQKAGLWSNLAASDQAQGLGAGKFNLENRYKGAEADVGNVFKDWAARNQNAQINAQGKNTYNTDVFNTQAQMYGADRSARAIENSDK